MLATADPFQPEYRAPLLDAAEVVPAPAVVAGMGTEVEDVDLAGRDPPERPGVVEGQWLIAGGRNHLANQGQGLGKVGGPLGVDGLDRHGRSLHGSRLDAAIDRLNRRGHSLHVGRLNRTIDRGQSGGMGRVAVGGRACPQ